MPKSTKTYFIKLLGYRIIKTYKNQLCFLIEKLKPIKNREIFTILRRFLLVKQQLIIFKCNLWKKLSGLTTVYVIFHNVLMEKHKNLWLGSGSSISRVMLLKIRVKYVEGLKSFPPSTPKSHVARKILLYSESVLFRIKTFLRI